MAGSNGRKTMGGKERRPTCGESGGKRRADGAPCGATAIYANGRCIKHGGKAGRPMTHGLYSTVAKGRLREQLRAAGELENPLDLMEELALTRALLQQTLDRMDGQENRAAVEALLEEYIPDPQARYCFARDLVGLLPGTAEAHLPAAVKLIETVGKLIAAIERIRNERAITTIELKLLIAALVKVLDSYVDPDKRGAVLADLGRALPAGVAGSLGA